MFQVTFDFLFITYYLLSSSPLTPHPSSLTPHPSPLTPHPSPLTPEIDMPYITTYTKPKIAKIFGILYHVTQPLPASSPDDPPF